MWTKEQQRAYHKAWSKRNRKRIAKYGAAYREKNRETVRARVAVFNQLKGAEYSAKYRAKHPERRREICARYRRANAEAERRYRKIYAAANLDKLAAKSAERRATKMRATPAWCEHAAVSGIYETARKAGHVVDHIVPLKSEFVCGLHCRDNLRAIDSIDNLRKGNRYWPDMWG